MSANTNKRLVAIVTSASSGMGLGITRALLERGYRAEQVLTFDTLIDKSRTKTTACPTASTPPGARRVAITMARQL